MKYPALILAGGLGTRLRSVEPVRPKPMVLVLGEPFLFWLVKHLARAGFTHFIFSVGYKAQFIRDFDWQQKFGNCHFTFFEETTPLGTGGATRAVFEAELNIDGAWVINGDTLLTHPLSAEKPESPVEYAALGPSQVFDAQPNLKIQGRHVTAVSEKEGRFFDGGQVFVAREVVIRSEIKSPCSIHQLIQPEFDRKNVGFKMVEGTCYDIGTPQRLARFESYLKSYREKP